MAAATFVIGGAAGYAVGHITSDDDRSFPTRFSRDGDGFRGGGPGFGPGQSQQNQQGQAPQQGPGTNS